MKLKIWILALTFLMALGGPSQQAEAARRKKNSSPVRTQVNAADAALADHRMQQVCGATASRRQVSKVTSYFTPVSQPGTAKGRHAMEGNAVIVNADGTRTLKMYNGKKKRITGAESKSTTACQQGYGSRSNCLDACRSIAANPRIYAPGSILFFPALRGKTCNGQPHDGYMIVDNTGGAFRKAGAGRLDFFGGLCKRWNLADECTEFEGTTREQHKELMAALNDQGGASFCVADQIRIRAGYNPIPDSLIQLADAAYGNSQVADATTRSPRRQLASLQPGAR